MAPRLIARRSAIATLAALSVAWLVVRGVAAARVGFGDSEALYACYALHPQPAYLDHPGLVGIFARAIGHGGAPTPAAAHAWTAVLATIIPWFAVIAARAAGASWRAAAGAGIALAVVPETAVGLFAMTPDLLLAVGWLGALALALGGLRAAPGSTRASLFFLGAGLAVGAACAAKVTAVTLAAALIATYLTRPARAHARTIWPWAGLVAGALVVLPIALYEARADFPMLRHRLSSTQADAGISLRNAAALVLGQIAYLSPPFVFLAAVAARDLFRAREEGIETALLFRALVIPIAVLLPLSLWSRVAEPHWLAPPLLALPIFWARRATEGAQSWSPRIAKLSVALALALSVAVHAWVLAPSLVRLVPASYDPRLDLASELYGWPDAVVAVRKAVAANSGPDAGDLVVVGPHWIVCGQLHAALGAAVAVGCATPIADDFDTWLPRARWRDAETVVFVSDNRFDVDTRKLFPDRIRTVRQKVTILRGDRVGRVFVIDVLERRAQS